MSESSDNARVMHLKNAFRLVPSDGSDTSSNGSDKRRYLRDFHSTKISSSDHPPAKRENAIISLTNLAKDMIDNEGIEKALMSDIAVSESSITSSNASIGGAIISRELKNISSASRFNQTSELIVGQMLRLIKKLDNTKHRRLGLYEFIDMVRDLLYPDVSLVMFSEYQKSVRYYPKDHYFHYYVYFLNYGAYYHLKRYKSEIPDEKTKRLHCEHFKLITDQMNYIYTIIKNKKIALSVPILDTAK